MVAARRGALESFSVTSPPTGYVFTCEAVVAPPPLSATECDALFDRLVADANTRARQYKKLKDVHEVRPMLAATSREELAQAPWPVWLLGGPWKGQWRASDEIAARELADVVALAIEAGSPLHAFAPVTHRRHFTSMLYLKSGLVPEDRLRLLELAERHGLRGASQWFWPIAWPHGDVGHRREPSALDLAVRDTVVPRLEVHPLREPLLAHASAVELEDAFARAIVDRAHQTLDASVFAKAGPVDRELHVLNARAPMLHFLLVDSAVENVRALIATADVNRETSAPMRVSVLGRVEVRLERGARPLDVLGAVEAGLVEGTARPPAGWNAASATAARERLEELRSALVARGAKAAGVAWRAA